MSPVPDATVLTLLFGAVSAVAVLWGVPGRRVKVTE